MDRNKLKIVLFALTAVFAIVAIVLFILGLAIEMGTLPKVILIIVSVICLALAGELGYFTYLMMDTNPNYFLYSSKAKRNMPVQKLTFQIINARMNRFLAGYAPSEGKIWNDRILDNPYLDMPDEFKPIVAYKLLFGLADKDAEAGWRCLENASDDTVAFICRGIESNGDRDFASAFSGIMADRPREMSVVRDYLVKNKRYIQSKMTKYVIDHISEF